MNLFIGQLKQAIESANRRLQSEASNLSQGLVDGLNLALTLAEPHVTEDLPIVYIFDDGYTDRIHYCAAEDETDEGAFPPYSSLDELIESKGYTTFTIVDERVRR